MAETSAAWCITDILKRKSGVDVIERSQIPTANPTFEILRDDFIRRAMFFRRDTFLSVGKYDETMRYREDWDLNIRMLAHGRSYVYIPEPLYLYSWRAGSITTGLPGRVLPYTEKLLRKHHKRMADEPDNHIGRLYAALMWGLGRRYLYEAKDLLGATRCVVESVRYDFRPARLLHPFRHHLGLQCSQKINLATKDARDNAWRLQR